MKFLMIVSFDFNFFKIVTSNVTFKGHQLKGQGH